jgi:hypothetical protein
MIAPSCIDTRQRLSVPAVEYDTNVAGILTSRVFGRTLAPAPQTERVTVCGHIRDGWTVRAPLDIVIDNGADGWFVASCHALDLYGEGASRHDAIQDYLAVMVDDYRFWQREEACGAANAKAQLAALERYLQPPAAVMPFFAIAG